MYRGLPSYRDESEKFQTGQEPRDVTIPVVLPNPSC